MALCFDRLVAIILKKCSVPFGLSPQTAQTDRERDRCRRHFVHDSIRATARVTRTISRKYHRVTLTPGRGGLQKKSHQTVITSCPVSVMRGAA